MTKVLNKIEQLKKYDEEYFNGIQTITDTEYDILKEQAKQEFPNDTYFKTMGSEYVTETTVRNLGVTSIEEMYELDELDIASIEGFGIKKAEQVYYEIQKTLSITPDKLLAAFGIAGIGKLFLLQFWKNMSLNDPDVTTTILKALYIQWKLMVGELQ